MLEDDVDTLPPPSSTADTELSEALEWLRDHGVITTPSFER
jgi:hypothetical protein